MNLFSKLRLPLIVFLLGFSPTAFAVNVMAVYTAACKRELGTIIRVNDHMVDFLTLSGQTKQIRSHEIIYLAYYPLDQLPLSNDIQPNRVDRVHVFTKHDNEIVPLTRGWPIGFTKDKIAFLTDRGQETLISRRNIYQIKMSKLKSNIRLKRKKGKRFNFIHPYIFSHCDRPNKKSATIYPQQVLSNTIMIKRELDQLERGHQGILRYHREQDFYPVPEVHKNETSLALWHSFGSRYGSSTRRTNNVTPLLTDAYSSDIFDYQHLFSTGSGPMLYAMHEEPQTHVYYTFKASYFHFSAMADPSLILVGKKYKWDAADFTRQGGLANPVTMIEMGFDVGNFSLDLYLTDLWQVGLYAAGNLTVENMSVPRLGFTYGNHKQKFQLSVGQGQTTVREAFGTNVAETLKGNLLRFNYSSYHFNKMEFTYSFITRNIDYESTSLTYSDSSLTNALYGNYIYKTRYKFGGMLSVENFSQTMTGVSDYGETFLKVGGFASLSF